jgi:hypothetical protein
MIDSPLSLRGPLKILPGAVDGRDGISFLQGVRKELHKVVSSDDTRRYEINKGSHGESVLKTVTRRM